MTAASSEEVRPAPPEGSLAPPTRKAGRRRSPEEVLLGGLGVLLAIGVWQLLAASGQINPLIFAGPVTTVGALFELVRNGEIFPHVFASTRLLLSGLFVAVVSGWIVGFAAGWFPTVRGLLLPHVALLYSTPSIALMPLLIVFFGLGFASHLAVVVLLAFFPAYYSALDAVRTSDPNLIKVARSFTAPDTRLFRTVVLPGSVPLLISGLRIALGKAITAIVVVELYASTEGLGYFLNVSGIRFETAELFATILLLAIAGLVGNVVLHALESRFDNWRPKVVTE